MASNDFTIDKQEYLSVFRVFDKNNTGTISIQQVNEYIKKFEEVQIKPTVGAQIKKNKVSKDVPESGKLRQVGPNQDQKQIPGGTSLHQNSLSMNGYKRPGRTLNQANSFKQEANNQHLNSQNKTLATKPGVGSGASKYQSPTKRFQQQSLGPSLTMQNPSKEPASAGLQIKPRQLNNALSSENQNVNGSVGESLGVNNQKQGSRRTELPHRINDNSSGNTSEDQIQKQTATQAQIDTPASSNGPRGQNQSITSFPNGKKSLQFEEFIELIKESCMDQESAENYLVYAFSMFDREKKGFINLDDLSVVFSLLGETVSEEELTTMIKIAGVKSNDKINFKEFVDFFYKVD